MTVLNRAPGAPVGKPMSDEILQNGSTPSMHKLQQLAESGGFQVQYQDTTQVSIHQTLKNQFSNMSVRDSQCYIKLA